MERPDGFDEEEFKEIARKIPKPCFEEAVTNAFFLATNEGASDFDKLRFKLLQEVMNER